MTFENTNVLAQVVLTPAESKKLIAMAVAELDMVKKARTIILHPSSSTYFIVETLTGSKPKTNIWLCGVILPKGLCSEMAVRMGRHTIVRDGKPMSGPAWFAECWVIREGKVSVGIPLAELLSEMSPDDVYIKGVNAIDSQGNVGVLIGNVVEGGTIGLVISKWKEKKFNLLFPVGLEKMIPGSIAEVAKETKERDKYTYGMGLASYLLPCPPGAPVITETKAIEILSGAAAIPMAAGGLSGAEGAIVLLIKGDKTKVNKAVSYVELAKGAELPPIRVPNCYDCPATHCKFSVSGKPWVKW
jgi:hypothetical protein